MILCKGKGFIKDSCVFQAESEGKPVNLLLPAGIEYGNEIINIVDKFPVEQENFPDNRFNCFRACLFDKFQGNSTGMFPESPS